MTHVARFHHWLQATRPKTLPAAAAPIAVGMAVAYHDGSFQLLPALAALIGALFLQVAVNLANDYFDAKNAIDGEDRLGPVRVTQSGLIPANQVFMAMAVCLVLAALVFVYLTMVAGPLLLVVGVASILAALAYSGGPYPLASHGLGELFVFVFFGLVAVGASYYIQTGTVSSLALVAAVPPGLLVTAIMVVNNLRDRTTDARAGKNTLAVRLGEHGTIRFYRALLVTSYLVPVLLTLGAETSLFGLLPLVTVPVAVTLWTAVLQRKGAELNDLLARTARLSLLFSLLFALGFVL